jgi:hypothetical protein
MRIVLSWLAATLTFLLLLAPAAPAEPIIVGADPCSDVCDFPLCVSGPVPPKIKLCSDICKTNFQVSLPTKVAPSRPGKVRLRFQGRAVTLMCVAASGITCRPCTTDADCDDSNARTHDVCLSNGACKHVCS